MWKVSRNHHSLSAFLAVSAVWGTPIEANRPRKKLGGEPVNRFEGMKSKNATVRGNVE